MLCLAEFVEVQVLPGILLSEFSTMLLPNKYSGVSAWGAAKGLNQGSGGGIPTGTSLALIQAEGQDFRWRADGTDPDATTGMLLAEGDVLEIDSAFSDYKFVPTVAAGAILNIHFYTSS